MEGVFSSRSVFPIDSQSERTLHRHATPRKLVEAAAAVVQLGPAQGHRKKEEGGKL